MVALTSERPDRASSVTAERWFSSLKPGVLGHHGDALTDAASKQHLADDPTRSIACTVRAWHTSAVESLGKIHHTALTVSALERSAEWYERVLGMVEVFREGSPTRKAVVYRFANGGMSVGLVEHVGSHDQNFDPTANGLDHLAFSVASEQDMQDWAAHLDRQGVEHSGPIAIPPGQILNFKDPDGIALSLFWDRES